MQMKLAPCIDHIECIERMEDSPDSDTFLPPVEDNPENESTTHRTHRMHRTPLLRNCSLPFFRPEVFFLKCMQPLEVVLSQACVPG